MKGGAKVAIEAHRHEGIFIARGKEDALVSAAAFAAVRQPSVNAVTAAGCLQVVKYSRCVCLAMHVQLRVGSKCSLSDNAIFLVGAQVTKNMVVGESVYGEKRISVEVVEGEKAEYRVWNPFRSKLAASVLAGVDNVHVKPGAKVNQLVRMPFLQRSAANLRSCPLPHAVPDNPNVPCL